MQTRASRIFEHWRRAPEVLACARETPDVAQVALAYLGIREPSYPITVRLRSGEQFRVETHHDLVTLWVIFFRGEYQVPQACTTIVDAGANIGVFSVYAARCAPGAMIHALEPFPSTRDRLEETVKQNGLNGRVKIYPYALASEAAGSTLQMSADGPSQSRGARPDALPNGVVVPARSLEQFLGEAGIVTADLLKMDIEGGEHDVFHGASREILRCFQRVALEYHPNGSAHALFQKLSECGFTCTHDARVVQDSGVAHFLRDDAS